MAVGALAVGLGACGGSSSPPMTPTAYVTSATQATLAHKSADVTLHGLITAAGQQIPMTGTGQVDFTDRTMTLNATMSAAGQSFLFRELAAGGHMYLTMTIAGHSFFQLTGKDWVELPMTLPTSGSGGFGTGNPVDQIRLLESKGARVVPRGTTTIDGTTVHGYSVTPSKAAMLAQVQKSNASWLTPAQLQQIETTLQNSLPPTISVWFDGSGLLRRIGFDMSMALARGSGGGQMDMDFSNYGVPVQVTAPPASDVISYSQFQQDLAQHQ